MWTALAALAVAPALAFVTWVLWRSPLPLSETVALLEDVARRTPASFFVPDTPYYRPLFHATLASANIYVRFGRGRLEPFLIGGAGGLWTTSVSSVTTAKPGERRIARQASTAS